MCCESNSFAAGFHPSVEINFKLLQRVSSTLIFAIFVGLEL